VRVFGSENSGFAFFTTRVKLYVPIPEKWFIYKGLICSTRTGKADIKLPIHVANAIPILKGELVRDE
jgi:hypothetical protein